MTVLSMLVLQIILSLFSLLPFSEQKTLMSRDMQHALKILKEQPVIDLHNDLAYNLAALEYYDLTRVNLSGDLRQVEPWRSHKESHTDIPRMREGHVGAQFWAAFDDCSGQYKDSVANTLSAIDVIRRFTRKYSHTFEFVTTAQGIEDAIAKGKIASLIGVEGGHSIQFNFGILRTLYNLGVRYLTLTHNCNTPWADGNTVSNPSSGVKAVSNGLSAFGVGVVREMNRLGMMVDISHTSNATMLDALKYTRAPIIFSHSGSNIVCTHSRNIPDYILKKVAENGGVVCLSLYAIHRRCDGKQATIEDVVADFEHMKKVMGPDHICIGGDYDGVDELPVGLDDVSSYPKIFAALVAKGWKDKELKKLAGRNVLRVFRAVEKVKQTLSKEFPAEGAVPLEEVARVTDLNQFPLYKNHSARAEDRYNFHIVHAEVPAEEILMKNLE